jgi:hypothetical protein
MEFPIFTGFCLFEITTTLRDATPPALSFLD